MNSPGSHKSLLLITALYSLHTYQIIVVTVPVHEVGCVVTLVVGWLVGWSLVVTKADCDLGLQLL